MVSETPTVKTVLDGNGPTGLLDLRSADLDSSPIVPFRVRSMRAAIRIRLFDSAHSFAFGHGRLAPFAVRQANATSPFC
jgi:hypothetical protein